MQIYQEIYAKQSEEILSLFLDLAEEGEQPKILNKLKKTLKQAQINLDRMEQQNKTSDLRVQIWQQQNDIQRTISEIQTLSSDSDDDEEFVYNGSKYHLINMIVLLLTLFFISQYP